MIKQKQSDQIHQLRALSLVIAQQIHSVRQHLARIALQEQGDLFQSCKNIYPAIPWEELIDQKRKLLDNCRDRAVCLIEEEYPDCLRQIPDPPWIIFGRGAPISSLKAQLSLAIVGCRRADFYGLEMARDYALQLAQLGIQIVSGLALGIDAAAHRGALMSKLPFSTAAVMGSGLDVIYPPAHQDLFSEIVSSGGLIISQFEPDTAPYPSNFLNRNRLVSGLCQGTLVIQATLKSGSLVTARHALEQGKEVFVIPGDIENKRFEGSNRLIQQGAHLITSVRDITEILGIDFARHKKSQINRTDGPRSIVQNQIIKILNNQEQIKVDELVRKLGSISFEKELLELEIEGAIDRLPGNMLRLSKG